MKKAVLLVFFNRLHNVQKVFEQIRLAKPPRLYLASDGPRTNVTHEREMVEQIREYILNHIDWDCEVKTRFLEINSGGCAYGVSGAVTWFFENEQDGIILEDDCVPSQSFFPYCEELLDKYKNNKKIWHITGYGYYQDSKSQETYYFAKIQHCWGWASWADRWKYFSLDLTNWDDKNIKNFSHHRVVQTFMKDLLGHLRVSNPKETWAWPWAFWIVAHNGYCINPYKNLITNIGVEGEHYGEKDKDNSHSLNTNTFEINTIVHPKTVCYNTKAIDHIYKYHYGIDLHPFWGWDCSDNASRFFLLGIPVIRIKKRPDKTTIDLFNIRIWNIKKKDLK